ncbi:hypothetical protein HYT05_01610 [Candidatus Kaiserbacteria bacterium]|nr:hypothetical protein [Candidatus Kaiserbacteria bacterium]
MVSIEILCDPKERIVSAVFEPRIAESFRRIVLPALIAPFDAHAYFKAQPGLWAHPSFLARIVARVEGDVVGEHDSLLLGASIKELSISKGAEVPFPKNKEIESCLSEHHLFTEAEVCWVVKQVKDGNLTLARGTHQLFLRDSFVYLFWSEDGPLGRWCVSALERTQNENLMTRVDFVLVPEM